METESETLLLLSVRQRRLVQLLLDEYPDVQWAAEKMGISETMAKNYLGRIYRRLKMPGHRGKLSRLLAGLTWHQEGVDDGGREIWQRMTRKQRRATLLLSAGLTNREIAEATGSTIGTIRVLFRDIYDKVGMDRAEELVLWFNSRSWAKLMISTHIAEYGPEEEGRILSHRLLCIIGGGAATGAIYSPGVGTTLESGVTAYVSG